MLESRRKFVFVVFVVFWWGELNLQLLKLLWQPQQLCLYLNDSALGACQKLAGGVGGGNFEYGFGNEVTHPCNGSEIC